MSKPVNILAQIFNDKNGKASSKRVITFIAFGLMCLAFLLNLAFSIPMEEFVYKGMMYVVGGGLGFSALEHLAPTNHIEKSSEVDGTVENPELLEG
jgi:hypothetical protein